MQVDILIVFGTYEFEFGYFSIGKFVLFVSCSSHMRIGGKGIVVFAVRVEEKKNVGN